LDQPRSAKCWVVDAVTLDGWERVSMLELSLCPLPNLGLQLQVADRGPFQNKL